MMTLSLVQFYNKYPKNHGKKEILFVTLISILTISLTFYYTYIIAFPINLDDFPTIKITSYDKINRNDYVNCTFELDDKIATNIIEPLNSKIKRRGDFNARYFPKKGYRIELSKRVSLLGMRKDDDWLLLSMFSDLNHMQIKLALKLWKSLKPTNPTAILPDSEFVYLYINNDFRGLYLLIEKDDRNLFGLDDAQNNINSSLIFQSCYWHRNFYSYLKEDWEQDWPNEGENIFIMDEIMTNLVSYIKESSNEEFFNPDTGIYTLFDKQNLIDFYVFNFFILHEDFWTKNYFIVRNTYPAKLFLIPWDFDRCFGQWLEIHPSFKWSIEFSAPDFNMENLIIKRNLLFERLLNNKEFRIELKNRWFQLRTEFWTEEFIIDIISKIYDDIKLALKIDSSKWYSKVLGKDWEQKINDAVDWLFDWIIKRLEFCDIYFENMNFA